MTWPEKPDRRGGIPAGAKCAGWVAPYLEWRLVNEQGQGVKKGERG